MLTEYIRKAAALATTHHCTHQCHRDSYHQTLNGTLYAEGTPPPRAMQKLAALAARYGYTLVRSSPLPTRLNGEGCSGFTAGWLPPEAAWERPEVNPFHIYLQAGLTPAAEFFVACHELAHIFAGHMVRNEHDAELVARKRRGRTESPDEELQAHLTAIAVAKQHGVRIRRTALCFLADRVGYSRRGPSQRDQQLATRAAQIIDQALNTVSYARAA